MGKWQVNVGPEDNRSGDGVIVEADTEEEAKAAAVQQHFATYHEPDLHAQEAVRLD